MAKRFHDTAIWDEDWFICLPAEYREFWFYVKDQCDHAGIWRPNIEKFNRLFNANVSLKDALKVFNKDRERISVLKSGRWFVISFIPFQYGHVLNLKNRVHLSIYQSLKYFEVNLESISPQIEITEGVKDKDKDKDSIKDVIDKNVTFDFERIWNEYENKVGKKEAVRHFNASVKTEQDYADIFTALANYKDHLKKNTWKKMQNGSTWFNNWRDWVNWLEPEQTGGGNGKVIGETWEQRRDRERIERHERVKRGEL